MRDFLVSYWFVILVGIAALGYIGYLLVNRKWTRLRELSYKLIRQAETVVVGTKMGQERFDTVLTQLYNMVPVWLRFVIPKTLLEEKLQEWFDLIKDSLDDGKINNSSKINE